MLRRACQACLMTLIALGAAGCRHKPQPTPLPVPPAAQVPLAPAPESPTPPQVAQVPEVPTPLPQKHLPKVKKPRRKPESSVAQAPSTPAAAPAAPSVPPPNETAAATPPPDPGVVGSLSAGGETGPEQKQKLLDFIAGVEKRLNELPASTREAQHDGLTKVRDFALKAREAIRSGDADGAWTLATKAKVLLDDLLK